MSIPPTIEVASLGMWDSIILMVMALVVFGPRRMPEIGRQIGRLMYELRKASSDFKFQMEEELRNAEESDRRRKDEQRLAALTAPAQTVAASTPSEPTPETPVVEASGLESPYPGEEQYPPLDPVVAPVTPAEETATIPTDAQAEQQTAESSEQTPNEQVNRHG